MHQGMKARQDQTPAGYGVRPVEDGAGLEALLRLRAANLHTSAAIDPRAQHRWYYEQNPAGPGQALLLMKDGEAIGCAGIGTRRFSLAGTPLRGALLGDFAVDREHRTGLPALVLQRAVARQVQRDHDFAYGFPNAAAVAVFRRVGFQQLGLIRRFVRLLRHGDYLARIAPHPALGRAAALLPDLAFALRDTVRSRRYPPGLALVTLGRAEVDERFDQLFTEQQHHHPMVGQRGAAFLRWRFFDRPGETHEVAALIDRDRGDRLCAYAVLHIDRGRAHLRDLFGGELALLLQRLAPALRSRGIEAMSVRFLGAGAVARTLLACGFHPREAERAVVVRPGRPGDPGADSLLNPERWYLTDADEDN
jgi:hypothetical protein